MKENKVFRLSGACLALLCLICFFSVGANAATRTFTKAGNSAAPSYSWSELKQMYSQLNFSAADTYASSPSTSSPYSAGQLSSATVKNTLDVINYYRKIAHVDAVTENSTYSVYAQHASLVNYVNNKSASTILLSHYPAQPSDMPNDIYQKGYDGAGASNLGWGYSTVRGSIAGYLDDSDSKNIAAVGHRRWILNPRLKQVGVGKVGAFSAVHCHDESNTAANADFVAWPGGNEQFPSDLFGRNQAWSIHLNSSVFEAPVISQVTVTLTRVADGKRITFGSSSTAGRFFIDAEIVDGYWIRNICAHSQALIFSPDGYFGDYSGAYKVVVTGLKTKSGESARVEYTVNFKSFADTGSGTSTTQALSSSNVSLSWTSKQYSGAEQKPVVTVKNAAGTTLVKGTDYTLTYSTGCKIPGTYTATVTGKGKYTGTVKKTFTITKQALNASRVTLSWTSKAYNGAVQKPTVTVKNAAGGTMTLNTSYTVSYSAGSKIPGSYTVTVTGKGYYTGKVTKTYTITKQPLNASRVTLSWTSRAYNGSVQKPTVTVKNAAGGTMTLNTSYTLSYSAGSKIPGSYTVTVTGKGYYTGKVTKTYTITKQALASSRVTLSATGYTYDGKVHKPTVTVKNAAGYAMTLNTSYTVAYSGDCKTRGTYTVTVTGKGYYTGTVSKTFTIR